MSFLPAIFSPTQSPVWQANPYQYEELLMTDFSGGLCTAYPPIVLDNTQFSSLHNFYLTKQKSLKVRGAFRPYDANADNDSVCPYAPLTFKWVDLGASEYLVASWDGGTYYEVSVWDTTNDRWAGEGGGTAIKTDLTNDKTVEFVRYGINETEDLIFCNGADVPQRWAGGADRPSSDLGLTAPTDTTTLATSNTATANKRGIQFNGTYHYKFTAWYDTEGSDTKYGESGPSGSDDIAITGAVVSSTSTFTTVSAVLTKCPAILTGATRNYVYRSPPDEDNGPYLRVGYYTTGTSFTDAVPVGEEGVEIPADGGTPPRLKHPVVFVGRLWGVGMNSSGELKNKLVWSEEGSPDMFLAVNFQYLPDDITALRPFNRDLYVFTKKETYVIPDGDPANQPLKVCDKGCSSHRSCVDVGNGIVWQGNGTIYWADFRTIAADGDFPIPIGDPIKNKISGIAEIYKLNSVACLHDDKYHLAITSPYASVNSTMLVWDVFVGTALLRAGKLGGWTDLDINANDIYVHDDVLYSADNTNKYIQVHNTGETGDNHTYTEFAATPTGTHTIAMSISTGLNLFGRESADKIFSSISMGVESSGISVNARMRVNDGEFFKAAVLTLGEDDVVGGLKSFNFWSDSVEADWLVWDIGLWDDGKWGGSSKGYESSHAKFGRGCKGRTGQLDLASSNSRDTEVKYINIYYRTLSPPA